MRLDCGPRTFRRRDGLSWWTPGSGQSEWHPCVGCGKILLTNDRRSPLRRSGYFLSTLFGLIGPDEPEGFKDSSRSVAAEWRPPEMHIPKTNSSHPAQGCQTIDTLFQFRA